MGDEGDEGDKMSLDSVLDEVETVNPPPTSHNDLHGGRGNGSEIPAHSLTSVGTLREEDMSLNVYAVAHGDGRGMDSAPSGSYGENFSTAHDGTENAGAAGGGTIGNERAIPNLSGLEPSYLIPADCSLVSREPAEASRQPAVSLLPIGERDSSMVARSEPQLTADDDTSKSVPDGGKEPAGRCAGNGNYDPYNDYHRELRLKPYQEAVVRRSLQGENDIILLPTGAGKTYVAIRLIIEHLYSHRNGKPKVVFFVPTAVLATQQLRKIDDHMAFAWDRRTCKVTGETNMPVEHLRQVIKDNEYVLLVVTPAIIDNYLRMYKEASLSDFTLLIFDEYHHAKKDHPYNELIRKCLQLKQDSANTPQLLGLTATIGIGDSQNLDTAKEYIIDMCAKFGLQYPPSESEEITQTFQEKETEEIYDIVENQRKDKLSVYIESEIMAMLETEIIVRLSSPLFEAYKMITNFPEDRYAQIYESFVVSLSNSITEFHAIEELREPVTYCMVALKHLRVYYETLQLINLLQCEHGMRYLTEQQSRPDFQSIEEIWTLFTDNQVKLEQLQSDVDCRINEKIEKLRNHLIEQFRRKPSKVIIFVQRRVVAQYMADLLNSAALAFRAKEFTSTGPSAEDSGMNPQQRIDVREGFEGDKYNILVSTSVLEEGIDIQACNMVVRYMYVKDMIAKIQTRGRARDEEGVMIALLDTRLARQEERNAYKEQLMYEALSSIRNMPEQEFRDKIEERVKRMTPVKAAPPRRDRVVTDKAKISCRMCGFTLGHMTDVRQYGKSHFLIIDGSLCEKVTAYPDRTVMKPMDGMVPYGRLLCASNKKNEKACGNQVGTLVRMSSGRHFGMWRIKGISVNNIPMKKYKDVKEKHGVEIHPIDVAELAVVGPDNQFPPRLLRESSPTLVTD